MTAVIQKNEVRCCYHNRVTNPAKSGENPEQQAQAKVGIRTVFLDRDGVINQKLPEGEYVSSWERFILLAGVPQAIAALNRAGLRVLVVTNQRGVALGRYSAADVTEIHGRLQAVLAAHGAHVDAFYFCPHDKRQCGCRKPLTGMFEQARGEFPAITAETSIMIGDSLSDIEFGRGAGMRTVFIAGDAAHRKPGWEQAAALADCCADDLPAAAHLALG